MLRKQFKKSQTVVNKHAGFSLVELMVAMLLSLFLLYGVVEIYLSNKQTNRLQNGFSQVQENGRMVVELISREIRRADFFGCLPDGNAIQVNLNAGYDADIYDFSSGGIGGANNAGASDVIGGKTLVAGTDTLVLRGTKNDGVNIEKPYMPTPAGDIHVNTGSGIQRNDVLMVSDCTAGNIFQVTSANPDTSGSVSHGIGAVTSGVGNAIKDFKKSYGSDAGILVPYAKVYFISNDGNGQPSLFVSDDGVPAELIPGVENMQVTYGDDSDGDLTVNNWLTANLVGDMEKVIAIRVVFIVRSYGSVGASGDGILRKTYTVTTNIRNRMI